jgi:hypothetical protein
MDTTYLISNNGLNIAVGIMGNPQAAQEDAVLAENLYGYNHSDHLFNSLIYMPSVKCFKKFLIMKEYFLIWSSYLARDRSGEVVVRPSIMTLTKHAIERANKIMKQNVVYENFMRNIHANNSCFSIGSHHDMASENES